MQILLHSNTRSSTSLLNPTNCVQNANYIAHLKTYKCIVSQIGRNIKKPPHMGKFSNKEQDDFSYMGKFSNKVQDDFSYMGKFSNKEQDDISHKTVPHRKGSGHTVPQNSKTTIDYALSNTSTYLKYIIVRQQWIKLEPNNLHQTKLCTHRHKTYHSLQSVLCDQKTQVVLCLNTNDISSMQSNVTSKQSPICQGY